MGLPEIRGVPVGVVLLPPSQSSSCPHSPCCWFPVPTWIGSLSEAPGNELLARTSCPCSKLQCVYHGPGPCSAPRRPHTLCVKLTDSKRPARRSSNRAAAIARFWSSLVWCPLVAQRGEEGLFQIGPRKPSFPDPLGNLDKTFGDNPCV